MRVGARERGGAGRGTAGRRRAGRSGAQPRLTISRSADENATLLGKAKDGGHRTEVIGLCTDQMAAAVALAVETTRIALRLARQIWHNSQRINVTPGPWAATILGLETAHVQQLLDAFHGETKVPPARRIAIGVEARGCMTLFSPPSTQTRLRAWSRELGQALRIPTEARGRVHMPNVPPVKSMPRGC